MSTIGIVCEYNPFHKGHEYQINAAKELTGAEHVACLMSGHFLQRGTPALADKWLRTEIALSCGADAVFELPYVYATSSARDYATAAVAMMNHIGSIDYIVFGAETDNLSVLSELAHIISEEPGCISPDIRKYTSSGMSYGAARAKAVTSFVLSEQQPAGHLTEKYLSDVLSSPNNILAIEYLRALEESQSSIRPVLIPRTGSQYNSILAKHDICSASAIRNLLQNGSIDDIQRHVPDSCYLKLREQYNRTFPIFEDDMSGLLSYARLINPHANDVMDMDADLFNRLSATSPDQTFSETASQIKCRNFTLTHIQRALLHLIAGPQVDEYNLYKSDGLIYYAHLLGMQSGSGSMLRHMKKSSSIPIITKASAAGKVLSKTGLQMFSHDVRATRIYSNVIYHKYGCGIRDDYRRFPIIL